MDQGILLSNKTWGSSRAVEQNARSRVAVIMEHVERLAEEVVDADRRDMTSSTSVRRLIAARATRRQFFGGELFSDPAWDILLELYALRCEQLRASASKLCIAAGVPTTTALRWISKLESDGFVKREADPLDARRVWVEISDTGFETMKSYLQALTPGPFPF